MMVAASKRMPSLMASIAFFCQLQHPCLFVSVMRIKVETSVKYRKISNTIRTIFTKTRGPAAGVRIIHLN